MDSGASGPEPLPGAFTQALADLSGSLDDARSVADAAAVIVTFLRVNLGCHRSGIAVRESSGDLVLLGADLSRPPSDVSEVDRQMSDGARLLGTGETIAVADTRTGDERPPWASLAADLGLSSAQVVAMPPLRGRSTSLHMFWQGSQTFTPEALDRASRVAVHAGYSLRHVDRVANLSSAMSTRAIIGQAQGIIMERYQLTSAQAISFLRRQSQGSQTRVRDVASLIVAERDRTHGPGGRTGPP